MVPSQYKRLVGRRRFPNVVLRVRYEILAGSVKAKAPNSCVFSKSTDLFRVRAESSSL